MNGICIKSDFTDYYDILNDNNSNIVYNRYLKNCKQRGSALKYLRNIGIKTIEIKQVNKFFRGDGPIVVYTDPNGHNSQGKKIITVDDAMQSYENCIASKYFIDSDITIKYLQIGKRRFTLYFKKNKQFTLNMGELIDIKESSPEYNRLFGLPIFSIDYISNGKEMIAIDFNEVENLQALNINKYIDYNIIIQEIKDALIVYNKC